MLMTNCTTAPGEPPGEAGSVRDRRGTWLLLAGIVLLGGALRLYRLDALSLWLDEGFSVRFTRQDWATVLGLHGAYDFHPPLYFSLAKLAGLLLPEVTAGRAVSWLAGTLTLPVVYALGTRLLDNRAGLGAALTLALSPPHIWFSQEARPFAATVLAVGLSYLALAGFYQTAGRRWALTYGGAILVALYLNYSALDALLPQVLLLALIGVKQRRRTVPLILAGLAAGGGICRGCRRSWRPPGDRGPACPRCCLSMGTDGVRTGRLPGRHPGACPRHGAGDAGLGGQRDLLYEHSADPVGAVARHPSPGAGQLAARRRGRRGDPGPARERSRARRCWPSARAR